MKALKDIFFELISERMQGGDAPYLPFGAKANQIVKISTEHSAAFEDMKDSFYQDNERYFDDHTKTYYEFGCYYATGKGETALIKKLKTAKFVEMQIILSNNQNIIDQQFDDLEGAINRWYELFNKKPELWGVS